MEKYTNHGDGQSSSTVKLFEFQVGDNSKCVHFPFMASVLADLKIEERRFKLTLTTSFIALCISIVSLLITGVESSLLMYTNTMTEPGCVVLIHELTDKGANSVLPQNVLTTRKEFFSVT